MIAASHITPSRPSAGTPIALDDALREEVGALGRVEHLVSPNKIHHLWLGDWKAAYPAARLWGPATTIRGRPDLAVEAPLTDTPPASWDCEIDCLWLRGSPLLDEIVFFRRASRTAILDDLSSQKGRAFALSESEPMAPPP